MLEELLTYNDCKKCKLCCLFEEDELIDAPTFTEEEKENVIKNINSSIEFIKKNNIYQIVLNKREDGLYECPLLTKTGCILGSSKPFDCESWPLYVMKYNDDYVITVSNDCPIITKIDSTKIYNFIQKKFLTIAINIIKKYPDMITEYNRDLKIIYTINKKEIGV